ncbi:phosphopentomutase [Psychrobium sp. 1_MG-2023]|uniref:phosphopentomutase n=1 Tax=Psychrobium sp. 1_MG-2023 TaxID=3062624 RepID=UPI000C31DBAF|nr:phosphopentomutase [Psychrobium sp. 1_MG-2023]MDP2561805.1 phosphopentomutase [Psychrobium sp. 1_MG-2023]PKF55821.1 phosphopentomutase [Alteromonadales bacterium alter-6D02]
MKRVTIMMLDSLGIGASEDADKFGDVGANTLGSIAKACAKGTANLNRQGPLKLPNLTKLGLGHACADSSGYFPQGLDSSVVPMAQYGFAQEISSGKDTPSGHWEIAGAPVLFEWGYFSDKENSFPQSVIDELVERCELPGILGNCHGSGTDILVRLGEEHIRTGMPICYTSVDSVFQIAAHEETFGLDKLLDVCAVAREILNKYNIGRVIARPFIGSESANFIRTGNRRDLSVLPPAKTLLDFAKDAGKEVISIGKISDIYAEQGITQKIKATGLTELFDKTLAAHLNAPEQSIVFTNFVDFDSAYGHRRDIAGYAAALEYFDTRLPEFLAQMADDDLLVMTADHGCDPSWPGSDHTREHIPVIFYSPSLAGGSVGKRETFADIGQSIASYLNLPALAYGKSFL